MESGRRGVLALLGVLAGLAASGAGYQIVEGPRNVTALAGAEARFNCTVSPGWKLIMWALNGVVVLSVTPREPIITNDRFTSASYARGDGDFVSEMRVRDLRLRDAGRVRCSLQSSDLDAYAFLDVEVMGTLSIPSEVLEVTEDEPCNVTCRAHGWTPLPHVTWRLGVPVSQSSVSSFAEPGAGGAVVSVLTLRPQGNGTLTCVAALRSPEARAAVTVNLTVVPPPPAAVAPAASLPTWAIALLAVSFSLLLVLIVVLVIVFCCCCASGKDKKESSYQNEIRKSALAKATRDAADGRQKRGSENYGYSSDEPRAGQPASLPPKSAELGVIPEPGSSSSPRQGPPTHRPGPASRPHVSFDLASPRKVRNVTLV